MKVIRLCATLLCVLLFICMIPDITRSGYACTRAVYFGKDGSVISSSCNAGTADGMNEKGLAVNMLYLAESNL